MPVSLAGRLLDWDRLPFGEPRFIHSQRFVLQLKRRWDEICREAANSRRIHELHAARGDLLAVFERLIAFHKSYLGLLDLQGSLTDQNERLRWVREELTRINEELTRLRDKIFSNWHTVDDLALMLVEQFTLPTERLKEISTQHPPPQSWFEETIDPFAD